MLVTSPGDLGFEVVTLTVTAWLVAFEIELASTNAKFSGKRVWGFWVYWLSSFSYFSMSLGIWGLLLPTRVVLFGLLDTLGELFWLFLPFGT